MILSLIRFPLACIGQAVDIFWQMREQNKLVAALHTPDPATDAAVADSALTHPPVSAERPSSPNPRGAAGSHHELVELIAEVLAEHKPYEGGGYAGQGIYCRDHLESEHAIYMRSWPLWREHVARLIAERIEKATPPAPFRFGDLGRAARVINDYVATTVTDLTVTQMASLRNLADRLADAADADPNP